MRGRKKKSVVVGSATGFDLRDINSFETIQNIQSIHHAVGRTSRSVSEAFKDADYATPIWKCESDFNAGIRFLGGAIYGFATIGVVLMLPVLLIMWITK